MLVQTWLQECRHIGLAPADIDAAQLERTFRTNVFAMFYLLRAALPHLHEGARIITTTSVTAFRGSGHLVDYAATKGAIDTLTIGLARELASEGVRVNAVRPGLIDTEFHANVGWADRASDMGKTISFGRAGTAEETAEAIVWLLSAKASYVSGALLDVSGAR